mgnify:CR=1 FL=1
MASVLTWLDFSERERRKALDVIDQFRDEDTRDELGIGTVRDALADLLFPGISTIQGAIVLLGALMVVKGVLAMFYRQRR